MRSVLMNYETLVASFADQYGYLPKVSKSYGSAVPLKAREVAVILPSRVVSKVGAKKGRVTAVVTFVLVRNLMKVHQDKRLEEWDRVKEDAVRVVSGVELSGSVLKVSELKITPLLKSLSGYDEAAVEVVMTVVSNYTAADLDEGYCADDEMGQEDVSESLLGDYPSSLDGVSDGVI